MGLDEHYMRKAIRLAAKGAGRTSPNPMVGAVLVKNGVEVASGWHKAPGSEHAEVVAIRKAGDAHGCDLYVNLEPCCHHSKRTPPCVPLIISSGVRRVVIGMTDPNPNVAGRGIRMLRDAGLEVDVGILENECKRLNAAFTKWVTSGLPFVTLKMAMTLDGKVADRKGKSRWISCEVSRRQVHRLRAHSDAVMVGIGTVRKDDPLLLPGMVKYVRAPLRIIVDSNASLPLDSKLVKTANASSVLVAVGENASRERIAALQGAGIEVLPLPIRSGLVDVTSLLAALGSRDVTSVLVEGGPRLASSLLDSNLVDRVLLFIAPIMLGDPKALSLVADIGIRALDDAIRFQVKHISMSGEDVLIELEPLMYA